MAQTLTHHVSGFLSADSTPVVITGRIVRARIDHANAARYLQAADDALIAHEKTRGRKPTKESMAARDKLADHHGAMFTKYAKARATLRALYLAADPAPVTETA